MPGAARLCWTGTRSHSRMASTAGRYRRRALKVGDLAAVQLRRSGGGKDAGCHRGAARKRGPCQPSHESCGTERQQVQAVPQHDATCMAQAGEMQSSTGRRMCTQQCAPPIVVMGSGSHLCACLRHPAQAACGTLPLHSRPDTARPAPESVAAASLRRVSRGTKRHMSTPPCY